MRISKNESCVKARMWYKNLIRISSIISVGEEKGISLFLCVSNFEVRMAYFKPDPFKSRFELKI
jgi:hypothetical protein